MHEALQNLGLTKYEAKIYLAALGVANFTAGAIATRTKIKRSTVYLALSNLIKLGLILQIPGEKRKNFKAEDPKALEKLTKRMRRKAMDAEILLERIIPTLSGIRQTKIEEPKLLFYEGINAVKNVLLDVSASKHAWYWFGASKEMLKKLTSQDVDEILEEGGKLRREAGLPKIKFITDRGLLDLPLFQKPLPSREIKFLKDTIKASSALILSQDKLILLNFSQPFAAVIQSAEVVEVVMLMYDLIWNGLNLEHQKAR